MTPEALAHSLLANRSRIEETFPFPIEHIVESLNLNRHEFPSDIHHAQARWDAEHARPSKFFEWAYFESPPETWEHLCGRAGWLVLDPNTLECVEFIPTVIN